MTGSLVVVAGDKSKVVCNPGLSSCCSVDVEIEVSDILLELGVAAAAAAAVGDRGSEELEVVKQSGSIDLKLMRMVVGLSCQGRLSKS